MEMRVRTSHPEMWWDWYLNVLLWRYHTHKKTIFTGLNMETSEELQVSNYGIGGHYEPHFDFARVREHIHLYFLPYIFFIAYFFYSVKRRTPSLALVRATASPPGSSTSRTWTRGEPRSSRTWGSVSGQKRWDLMVDARSAYCRFETR